MTVRLNTHTHNLGLLLQSSRNPLRLRVLVLVLLGHVLGGELVSNRVHAVAQGRVWDHSAELNGKRIAVIGSGASALQIIPEMQKVASELIVFQSAGGRFTAVVVPAGKSSLQPAGDRCEGNFERLFRRTRSGRSHRRRSPP